MKKNVMLSITILALLAVTVAVLAGSLVASGSQTRGVPGRDAKLSGQAFTLPATATIGAVEGSGAGFWIEGQGGLVRNFGSNGEAVGFQVAAGTYWVYPNLAQGKDEASVRVTFNW